MEFYDHVTHEYLNVIKRPIRTWRLKLELLDHWENTIGCIEQDIDYSSSGSITCNNEQGSHKNCSLTLINVDNKYTPTEDNPFWFNRKFRLYLGIVDDRDHGMKIGDFIWAGKHRFFNCDTYWFSKGVFIAQDVSYDSTSHTVSVNGVDKYAQLDGTLNVLQADEMNTVFEVGSSVSKVVNDILMLNMGNGLPLDPIEPIIDVDIASQCLYKEFTLSAGQYYGDFLNELATSFGCDIFYDNLGRLVLRRSFTDDVAYWMAFKAPAHIFNYDLQGYENPQNNIKLNGVNKIIVNTDNIETPNASYTAINHNPRSPLCYDKIGARTLPENGGIITINPGNIITDEVAESDPTVLGGSEYQVWVRCRDYAEYRLMQETCVSTSISFKCPPYLHLCEGDIIAISDSDFYLDSDMFIINSITFPLNTDSIELSVSNVTFLNSDIAVDSRFTEPSAQDMYYQIHYQIENIEGDYPPNQLIKEGESFVVATDYDEENAVTIFHKDGYELIDWIDNINDTHYELNSTHTVPNQNFTLRANCMNVENYIFEAEVVDVLGAGYPYGFQRLCDNANDYYAQLLELNDNRYYFYGRNNISEYAIVKTVLASNSFKYIFVPKVANTPVTFNNYLSSILGSGTNGGKYTVIKFPKAVENLQIGTNILQNYNDSQNGLRIVVLPDNLKNFICNVNFIYDNDSITSFVLGKNNDVICHNESAKLFCDCSQLLDFYAYKNVTIYGSTSGNNPTKFFSNTHCNMTFYNGLTIYTISSFFTANSSNAIRTIIINNNENETVKYKKGLQLWNSSFIYNCAIPNYDLFFNDIYANSSYCAYYNTQLKTISVNGDVFADSNSGVLSNVSCTTSNLNVGDITIKSHSNFLYNYSSTNGSISLNNATIENSANALYNLTITNNTNSKISMNNVSVNSAGFVYNTNVEEVEINDLSIVYDSSVYYGALKVLSNNSFTTLIINGAVTIDLTDYTGNSILSSNPNLTDIYFYSDNLTVTGADPADQKMLTSNNANLKIHGIANGNVQAFAEAYSIPFVAIEGD